MTGVSARVHIGENAEAEKPDAELVADFPHLRQMFVHLLAGFMDRLERRAGKLELAAGLERDRAAAIRLRQADDVVPLHDRRPSEARAEALEQGADRARPA